MRTWMLLAGLVVSAGCGRALGPIGLLAAEEDVAGVKLLRPGVLARSCQGAILGVPLSSTPPTVKEALRQLLATDPEANVVTNAEVAVEQFTSGLYNRCCVTVRGNLGRLIPTVTLPAPAGHGAHGHSP